MCIRDSYARGHGDFRDYCSYRVSLSGGGVLYADDGSTVTIYDSYFTNNSATIINNTVGGVVYAGSGVNIVIMRSHFTNNNVLSSGGVVYAQNDVNVTITNSQFTKNTALDGGVVYAHRDVTITITHSQFINNSALEGGGGGIVCAQYNVNITITHSQFTKNKALGEIGGGGVVSATSNVNITVTHSKFTNNIAQGDGGVLSLNCDTKLVIHGSRFLDNRASNGGTIYARGSLTLNSSSFDHNSAGNDGGVLYLVQTNAEISGIMFNCNMADGDGGIMHTKGATSNINNCVFHSNSAGVNGGLIASEQRRITGVYGGFFDSNSAGHDGGVIALQQGNITICGGSFENNSAGHDGGVIVSQQGNITVYEVSFHNNSAGTDGGVIISEQGNITVCKGSFESNLAGCDRGVIVSRQGNITVCKGSFENNSAGNDGGVFHVYQGVLNIVKNVHKDNTASNDGGVISTFQSTTYISESFFSTNIALHDGGAVSANQGSLSIYENTNFRYNTAHNDGGVVHAYELISTTITGNNYNFSKARNRGGVWFVYHSNLTVIQSILSHNEAADGGVIYTDQGNITIDNISCVGNKADKGGVVYTLQSNMSVNHASFGQNSAAEFGGAWFMEESQATLQDVSFLNNNATSGGAMYSCDHSVMLLNCTIFRWNSANNDGGAIHSSNSELNSFKSLLISNNRANVGVVYLLGSKALFYGQMSFSDNSGSFLVFNTIATFMETASFVNCSEPKSNDTTDLREGGALTVIKSSVIINGSSTLSYNCAENGGAIHVTEWSKVYVNGETTIAYNSANDTGGGVYLDLSQLHCQGNSSLKLVGNYAIKKGGGVYAISSTIDVNGNITKHNKTHDEAKYSGSLLYFTANEAEKGGGLCLEINAKLNIFKSMPHSEPISIVNFTANKADYGGAVHVSDDSNLGMYKFKSHYKECFFQILAIYGSRHLNINQESINTQNIFFSQNYAQTSGSSLFGGLINQCKLQHSTELQNISPPNNPHPDMFVSGISYMTNISNINMLDVSSQPTQLCFCKGNLPDCNYQPDPIRVNKGKRFSVELIAMDQVNHPVDATINSILDRTVGGLGMGQATQNTSNICTNLTFNLFSPNDGEKLIMKVEGSYVNSPQSEIRLTIQFTACDSCPIGFERHDDEDTNCECICDSRLEPYITKCNASTELLERSGNFWITNVSNSGNSTSGYLIHPYCPLNYCLPPTTKVEINLNVPNGADVQCANGHSGMLCGTCQCNFSLSLGSSRCIPCSTHWPTTISILIAAFLAGIALVTLLLILNLTVAVGTLNGIIFYANIIAASYSNFLPMSKPNFATIFISWLNLEIGFDACFFGSLDAYWKTLLQLAFPMYVIILVIMVIFISEHSTKFAQLVAKRNPVATLATLILFSYAKFLNNIIASLSYATLIYPDGSHRVVWLPDATVEYLRGKHIVLFTTAILILLAGVAYTTLLFSWQWLLSHQDKKVFSWTRHQKLCHFIEPYHAPYTFEQRYWTGLLLFVRVILYVVSAVNFTGDPQVSLVSTIILVGLLLLVKGILGRKIYKAWSIDVMEMIMYFNIISFAALTLKTGTSKNQTVVAYISIMITFAILLAVIIFHMFRHTSLLSTTKVIKTFMAKSPEYKKINHSINDLSPGDEDNQLLITHSVVEISNPYLEQESAVKKEKVNTPTASPHVVMVVDDEIVPQLDSEESSHLPMREAAKMENDASLSTQTTMSDDETGVVGTQVLNEQHN